MLYRRISTPRHFYPAPSFLLLPSPYARTTHLSSLVFCHDPLGSVACILRRSTSSHFPFPPGAPAQVKGSWQLAIAIAMEPVDAERARQLSLFRPLGTSHLDGREPLRLASCSPWRVYWFWWLLRLEEGLSAGKGLACSCRVVALPLRQH